MLLLQLSSQTHSSKDPNNMAPKIQLVLKATSKLAPKKLTVPTVAKKNIVKMKIKATPPESDSLRIFYTSLLRQNRDSKMAIKWCTEHGLLPIEDVIILLKNVKL